MTFASDSVTHLENKARASARRIRQPPEKVLVAFCCICAVNPRPARIMEARAGALSASMFCSCA